MNGLNLQLFDAIAWTIIHSLWQGALIFIVTLTLFLMNKRWNSKIKFNIALISMVSLFTACVVTFAYQYVDNSTESQGLSGRILYYYSTLTVDQSQHSIVNFINDNTLLISNF